MLLRIKLGQAPEQLLKRPYILLHVIDIYGIFYLTMDDINFLYTVLLGLKKQRDFVFLWNGKTDTENYKSFVFLHPKDIISACQYYKVKDCFRKIEGMLSKGYYVAGYICYEAGYAFEETLPKTNISTIPILWFGVYDKPIVYNHKKGRFDTARCPFLELPKNKDLGSYNIKNIRPTKRLKTYLSDISKIKDYIKKGQTYQVNYTFKYKFSFYGCPYRMFFDLNKKQSVPYAAFISFGSKKILSLSPELFFKKRANTIRVKPMKGTIERGKDISEDLIKERQLEDSIKNRAENIMIVDMLRNDLSRISKTGSVKTIRLFETEKYQTLFQMTSTVISKLKYNPDCFSIFKNIFPSGSVTGAPKIRTMQIINELENAPRNIYTGSIGYISPEKNATFNVGIRTISLDKNEGKGELGIGSGITISSDPIDEFNECRLKAHFFTRKYTDFELIETLLWHRDKFFLLDMHLKRLRDSASYFDYKYSRGYILKSLAACSRIFRKDKSYKVRLLLRKSGEVKISTSLLKDSGSRIKKITFSKKATDSSDIFLYHKTTNRNLYDSEYLKHKRKGYADVIFLNQKWEVAEGAISNIIVKKGRYYYTPPVNCGLLNGIYRQHLLNTQQIPLKEKVLFKDDIIAAGKLFICNSVRGLVQVELVK